MMFTARRRWAKVHAILNEDENGIAERIDQNRALIEALQDRCPEVLQNHPWIGNRLKSQDAFLCELAVAAGVSLRSRARPMPREDRLRSDDDH